MISVFYRPEQAVLNNDSFSPSAGKPRQVMSDWQSKEDIAPFFQIEEFDPLYADDIKLAHCPNYVDGVLSCRLENGFGNRNPEVAKSLLHTTGSMYAAAKHAVLERTVTVSPTSGFHHANHGYGGGFCTFNGLVIAALKLKQEGLVRNVLILDFDAHYGDGTDSCIASTGSGDWLKNITRTKHYDTSKECLALTTLPRLYPWVAENMKSQPDLVIYQAGADLWSGDPLHAGLLSMKQMAQRDANIFAAAHQYNIPIVFNLAGGYAKDEAGTIEPVLSIHRQTMQACIDIHHKGRAKI